MQAVIAVMRGPQLKRTMVSRDHTEHHRAASPLELFFDLTFVVAVAQAVAGLHHMAVEGHFADGILRYSFAFFVIWWPWVNFTWFASAFDTDDIAYRLAVFVQIGGNLTIAAGIPRFFRDMDLTILVIGYVIMRLGLVELWLRAARNDPSAGAAARRYALGIVVLQICWTIRLFLPDWLGMPLFVLFIAGELLIPVWAERAGMTRWHPGHIAERYGLFTIIVLGESILGASISIQSALDEGEELAQLLMIAAGGLLVVFAMWWLYFDGPTDGSLRRFRSGRATRRDSPFLFGYGHLFIFATAAAVGAGLEIAVDFATHHAHISAHQAAAMIAVPVALYLGCMWTLRYTLRQCPPRKATMYALAIGLVLATIWIRFPVLAIGLIAATAVTAMVVVRWRLEEASGAPDAAT
jgi:low temperature requirement protein LtrA